MSLRVKYFAWLRERVGIPEEDVPLPPEVRTVADLVEHLRVRDEGYAAAFANPELVRAAVDRRHAPAEADIRAAREVAFFPPMTGG